MTALDGLGAALRALRESRGLSQQKAGERMNLRQNRLSDYELGAPMDTKTLERILDGYGANLVELGRLLRPGSSTQDGPSRDQQIHDAVELLIQGGLRAGMIDREKVRELAPAFDPEKRESRDDERTPPRPRQPGKRKR